MKTVDGGNQAAPIIQDGGGDQLAVPITSNQLSSILEAVHQLIDEARLTNAILGEIAK